MDYSVIAVIGSFVGMFLGIWKIARDFRADLEKTSALLFKRFDDHKDGVDKKLMYGQEIADRKYQRADICEMARTNYAQDIQDIKNMIKLYSDKIDKILEERRNQS